MNINGILFQPTGNPQTDLVTYAKARGISENQAKAELEAAIGTPDEAAELFVKDGNLSVTDLGKLNTTNATNATNGVVSIQISETGLNDDQKNSLRTCVQKLEEALRTEADCYNSWMNSPDNQEAENIFWDSVSNNSNAARILANELNSVSAYLNTSVLDALTHLLGAIGEEDTKYQEFVNGGFFENWNNLKNIRSGNSANLVRAINETGLLN